MDGEGIGGPVVRWVTAAPRDTHRGFIHLDERRPWEPEQPLSSLSVDFDLAPKRKDFLARNGGAYLRRHERHCRSVDLRSLFGPVGDQGPRPTCLAFAASDAHAALRSGWVPLSREYAFYQVAARAAIFGKIRGDSFEIQESQRVFTDRANSTD